uniref:Transactivator/viroplasmin protein n=1 Tax=Physostegia virginiana caulimovirus 2 TaxID=3075964 RepID=A0AA95Z420_9VIRU|nr:inclusion body matrix protein [Physostegia virginiana caulimovirus 2]
MTQIHISASIKRASQLNNYHTNRFNDSFLQREGECERKNLRIQKIPSEKMEEIRNLQIREKVLLIELESIRQQLQVYNESLHPTDSSDQSEHIVYKTEPTPELTATGKGISNPFMADILPKNVLGNDHQNPLQGKRSKLVNPAPKPNGKAVSSPNANGIGKDKTNPFKPVALVKSKMTLLGQKQEKKDFRLDYVKAVKTHTGYYAVFSNKRPGVYTEWSIAAKVCHEDKCSCKKYSTKEMAEEALLAFQLDSQDPTVTLQPVKKAKKRPNNPAEHIASSSKAKPESEGFAISFEDFRMIWTKSRISTLEDGSSEKFYTDDKASKSLFTFVEAAEPYLVHTAFRAGLTRMIYPSRNLQELAKFPKEFVKAIKDYRKKFAKANDAPIFLKVHSSLPDWSSQHRFEAVHFVQVGLSNGNKKLPEGMKSIDEPFPSLDAISRVRVQGLKSIVDKLHHVHSESTIRINHLQDNLLVHNKGPKQISESDFTLWKDFEHSLINGEQLTLGDHSKKQWCKTIRTTYPEHYCFVCPTHEGGEDPPDSGDSLEDAPLIDAYDACTDVNTPQATL